MEKYGVEKDHPLEKEAAERAGRDFEKFVKPVKKPYREEKAHLGDPPKKFTSEKK